MGQDQYRAVGAIHIHRNGLCTSLLCIFFLTSRTLKRRWVFPTCLATCYQNSCAPVVSYQGRGMGSRGCQVPPVMGILGEAGTLRSSRQGCGSAASACLPPWLLLPPKSGGAISIPTSKETWGVKSGGAISIPLSKETWGVKSRGAISIPMSKETWGVRGIFSSKTRGWRGGRRPKGPLQRCEGAAAPHARAGQGRNDSMIL